MNLTARLLSFAGGAPNLWGRLNALARRLKKEKPSPPTAQRALGERAEQEAARYLKKQGYTVLERNFRTPLGEIDLVAFKDGVVAFAEVRARTEPVGLDELSTVTSTKQRRLIRAGHQYVAQYALDKENVLLRFDVLALRYAPGGELLQLEHIVDAFHE